MEFVNGMVCQGTNTIAVVINLTQRYKILHNGIRFYTTV
jgi:hypothetical protein